MLIWDRNEFVVDAGKLQAAEAPLAGYRMLRKMKTVIERSWLNSNAHRLRNGKEWKLDKEIATFPDPDRDEPENVSETVMA